MAADAPPREDRPEATVRVVEFRLCDERFAVGVDDVDSIVDLEGETRVPRTSEAIDGVMDLRGEITAILDPRVYLGVEPEPEPGNQRVLVLDDSKDKQKVGLRVDEVLGVQEYGEDLLEDPESIDELDTTGVREHTIASIVRRPDGDADFEPVAWLDVDEVVARAREGIRDDAVAEDVPEDA